MVNERLTFGSFLTERWLPDVVRPTAALSTYESYERLVCTHILPALGRSTLAKLSARDIRAFMNTKAEQGKSPRTIAYLHAFVRAALAQAVRWDLVSRNVATQERPPKVTRKKVAATASADAQAIAAPFADHQLAGVVTVTLALGLRRGEVLGLRWGDVDLREETITVRHQVERNGDAYRFVELKTNRSRRSLALPPFVVAALRSHRATQLAERLTAGSAWQDWDMVFPTAIGAPQDGGSVTHQFQKRLKRAGLPDMPLHGLRHGAASLLLAKGVTLREIMELLGYSQISLTANTYSHLSPELKPNAAERRRLCSPLAADSRCPERACHAV